MLSSSCARARTAADCLKRPVFPAPPPAFTPGSDTTPQYDLTGAYVAVRPGRQLALVTTVIPQVAGATYIMPAGKLGIIARSRRRNGAGYAEGRVRYAAPGRFTRLRGGLRACRPSIAFDRTTAASWSGEEFDSSNVEPATGLLRADIKTSLSQDNGANLVGSRRSRAYPAGRDQQRDSVRGLECKQRYDAHCV